MRSHESASTFQNASQSILKEFAGYKGVEDVIASVKEKWDSPHSDPLVHADLRFEPWMEHQMLNLDYDLVNRIALQFHRLSIFVVLVRLRCPSPTQEGDDVAYLFSQSSTFEREFAAGKARHCRCCSETHNDEDWIVETLFAVNRRDGPIEAFDYSKLRQQVKRAKPKPKKQELTTQPPPTQEEERQQAILPQPLDNYPTTFVRVDSLLATNTPLQHVPEDVHSIVKSGLKNWLMLTAFQSVLLCGVVLIDKWAAIIIAIFFLIVGWFIRSTLKAVLAAESAYLRHFLNYGTYAGLILVGSGACGGLEIECKGLSDLANTQFSFGKPNNLLIYSGVFVLLFCAVIGGLCYLVRVVNSKKTKDVAISPQV